MAKKGLRLGLFITFEGIEGCGKSTHARLLYKYLKKNGYPCLYTKEPGGTKSGEKIRKLLLDPGNGPISDITELLLFEASRCQIVREVIKPALAKKMIVICDRFYDATMAYQGYGSGLDKGVIRKLTELAAGGLKPKLTIVLDIGTKKGLARATLIRRDRMEKKSFNYHNRVRKGYREIAEAEPGRVKSITTREDILATQKLVRTEVLNAIQRYKVTR